MIYAVAVVCNTLVDEHLMNIFIRNDTYRICVKSMLRFLVGLELYDQVLIFPASMLKQFIKRMSPFWFVLLISRTMSLIVSPVFGLDVCVFSYFVVCA